MHGTESCDYTTTTMAEKPHDSGKTFWSELNIEISLNYTSFKSKIIPRIALYQN